MNKEEQILCNHLKDLATMAYQRDYTVFSEFLTLNEQNLLLSIKDSLLGVQIELDGGHALAERKMVCFRPVGVGFTSPTPICLLKVSPKNIKFSEVLTHRDYLGAILNLGIERSKIGDIFVEDATAYIICEEQMAPFVCDNLIKVRHTCISCEIVSIKDMIFEPKFTTIKGSVASTRLDAILSLAFRTSRSKVSQYIEGEKVFVNGKLISSNSYVLKEGDIVSARGLGKFLVSSYLAKTKKDRLFIEVKVYS